jgi:hypothetical protein
VTVLLAAERFCGDLADDLGEIYRDIKQVEVRV